MKTRKTIFAVKVKESPIDGLGVFAKKHFAEGDVIGIISGLVPEEVDPECWYTCEFEDDYGNWWGIEPTYPFKYLNHSSDPNTDMTTPILIALRDIKAGEEITIDYGDEWDELFQEEDANESS